MATATRAITPGPFASASSIPSITDSSHILDANPTAEPPIASPNTAGPHLARDVATMEEVERKLPDHDEGARQRSPNAVASALLGHSTPNRTTEGLESANSTINEQPLVAAAKAAEDAQNEQESHPASMEGLTGASTATARDDIPLDPAVVTDPALETPQGKIASDMLPPSAQTDHSVRSHTYPSPFPPDSDQRGPPRNMSLPMAGYSQGSPKSPSTKRHKCPYCSTDFTRHHNLKSHLLTHSQEKPYECNTCQARFRRLHDLKRHTKLHTGERPHTCQRCGRKFARGDALARHNKGPGGCAGRRTSFTLAGDDDSMMEGLEYHHQQTAEPDGMDDDEAGGDRRGSEAGRKLMHAASTDDYGRLHGTGSTYPPPPNALGSNAAISPGSGIYAGRPHDGSPFPPGHAFSQPVGDSPKPLSPGQATSQGSADPSRNNMYARSNGNQAGAKAGSAHLPPITSSLNATTGATDPRILAASAASNPAGGANLRDQLIGATREDAAVQGMMNGKLQELEARFARMQDDYENRIKGLTDEIGDLKRQLSERERAR